MLCMPFIIVCGENYLLRKLSLINVDRILRQSRVTSKNVRGERVANCCGFKHSEETLNFARAKSEKNLRNTYNILELIQKTHQFRDLFTDFRHVLPRCTLHELICFRLLYIKCGNSYRLHQHNAHPFASKVIHRTLPRLISKAF